MLETRAIIIVTMILVTLLGSMLGFLFGALSSNGVAVPASANQTANLNYINKQLGSAYNNSLSSTNKSLQVPPSNLGFIGAFYVFGGLITSTFGYVLAVPAALQGTFTVYTGTLQSSSIAISVVDVIYVIAGLAIAVAGVLLMFEVISSVQKYRL